MSLAISYQFVNEEFTAQMLLSLVRDYLEVNDPADTVSVTSGSAGNEFTVHHRPSATKFTVRVTRVAEPQMTEPPDQPQASRS
jgi:hypothetical protein